nr:bifunctional folylpolyglutamate synthase/dihydrofolate synthase [uncultured Sulfurimonas sp.]
MLQNFLNAKPLYYDEIDYTRMPLVYESIKSYLPKVKIIHIIGTNAKGTTGRFLASALNSLGFNVGHYSSPHILEFNERIWKNGKNIDNETLEIAHKELQKLLSKEASEALSYFEYTTFLAMIVYKDCEYVVMEAGLGGEHDATAVFDKILTLVTPISYDHEAFLGNSLNEIVTTKLNAIQNSAILASQQEKQVYKIADAMAKEKSLNIKKYRQMLDLDDEKKIQNIAKKLKLQKYLVENLSLSISALKFLNIKYSEENFENSKLFGRLSQISKNVIIDVGHNPLAASVVLEALRPKKYVLVYNTYKDKDYKKILQILKPIIERVEIIDIDSKRAQTNENLNKTLTDLEIDYSVFNHTSSDVGYLVFGSFSVVEAFIKKEKKWNFKI